jgi:hypothetical protein
LYCTCTCSFSSMLLYSWKLKLLWFIG